MPPNPVARPRRIAVISRCLIGGAAVIVCVLCLAPMGQAGAVQVGPVSVPSAPSSFGDAHAPFASSLEPNAPLVGMATTPSGQGYWLVASDGGIFAFGDAAFEGSLGGHRLSAPIVGMAAVPGSMGYWLVGSDGGVFAFGTAHYDGSLGGQSLGYPIADIVATPTGGGYWLLPTSLVRKALGHMVLPPASTPSVPAVCAQSLSFGQDGTFEPLTCAGDTAVNVVAWDNAAPVSPSMLSLGPQATPNAVLAAFCTDLPHSTIPIEIESYTLASTYYGWQFSIPGTTFVDANC